MIIQIEKEFLLPRNCYSIQQLHFRQSRIIFQNDVPMFTSLKLRAARGSVAGHVVLGCGRTGDHACSGVLDLHLVQEHVPVLRDLWRKDHVEL